MDAVNFDPDCNSDSNEINTGEELTDVANDAIYNIVHW